MNRFNVDEIIQKATLKRNKAKQAYANAGYPNNGPLLNAYATAVDQLDHAELLLKKE